MRSESLECVRMPLGDYAKPAQNAFLIFFVGDSESGLESRLLGKFSQQLRAE